MDIVFSKEVFLSEWFFHMCLSIQNLKINEEGKQKRTCYLLVRQNNAWDLRLAWEFSLYTWTTQVPIVHVLVIYLYLRDQQSMRMHGCIVYMDFYTASNGSCFMITWIIFLNHLLEVGLNTKPGDHGTPNAYNHWFILFYNVWGSAWIEIHRNSIWLRAWSHMTSHYAWGSVTSLHRFGGFLGQPLDTLKTSHQMGHGIWWTLLKQLVLLHRHLHFNWWMVQFYCIGFVMPGFAGGWFFTLLKIIIMYVCVCVWKFSVLLKIHYMHISS